MGEQSKNGRLGAAVAKIKKALVAIKCEVCEEPMGFLEKDGCASPDGAAGYCSDRCIRAQAELNIELE